MNPVKCIQSGTGGPSVVVYAHSDDDSSPTIEFHFSQAQLRMVVERAAAERGRIAKMMKSLPPTSEAAPIVIRGPCASQIAWMIDLLWEHEGLKALKHAVITGAWGPPPGYMGAGGLITWMDKNEEHHAAVVYAQGEALNIVRSLEGQLGLVLMSAYLDEIRGWGLPAQKAKAMHIGGPAAAIISKASLYAEAWSDWTTLQKEIPGFRRH